MIRLCPAPTFKVDVLLTVPGEEQPGKLELTVRWKSREERVKWIESAQGRTDADALAEVVTDWGGPVDEAGQPVPFSVEAFKQLVNGYDQAGKEILEAYLRGHIEGRRKN
ncbi:phage tail assembly chaperone [Methyloversatilis universalis]|uniref:phage tail assembly chaperone n=1 Tax=Methyloversatilis universalis TaxID=378211 RepID=UPI0009D9C496|nr:phage tail assembly chaperone [Methyloversatilis universalis]